MKKTPITAGGGKVHEWVTSLTVRDSNFSEAVIGILSSSDFHARHSDIRYLTWLKGLTNSNDLDELLSRLLNEATPPVTISAFIADCAAHRVDVASSAFRAFRQIKGADSAKFLTSVYVNAPDDWMSTGSQLIGMRICSAILDCVEYVKPLTLLLERLLRGPGIGIMNREVSRVLLPINNLPCVKEIPINWDDGIADWQITDNDLVRVETACISGSITILKSLLPVTPSYAACLIRFALSQNSENVWRVISFLCHANEKFPDWALCLVYFASTMDLFFPSRAERLNHVLVWIMREDHATARRLLVFISAQMKELKARDIVKDNIARAMIGDDFVKQFIGPRRSDAPEDLVDMFCELHCGNISSPDYSDS